MYEKENFAVNVVSAPGHDGFYHSLSVSGGDVYDDVSSGNNGETEQSPVDTVSSGDGAGVPDIGTVSAGDGDFQTTASADYTDSLVAITDSIVAVKEEITALSGLVFLLFIFLLLTWTERKINGVVGKFTQWKKGR